MHRFVGVLSLSAPCFGRLSCQKSTFSQDGDHMETEAKDIDHIIGQNLRTLRKQAGMSQAALGQTVGITFQQIQKYESGQNRIAGSRM